jgi:hypothetical protein
LAPDETVVADDDAILVTDRRIIFAWTAWSPGWHSDAVSFDEITRWARGRRHDGRPLLRIEHPTHLRIEHVPAHRILLFSWGNAEAEVPRDDVTLTFASRRDAAFRAIVERLERSDIPEIDAFVVAPPGTRENRTRRSQAYLRR